MSALWMKKNRARSIQETCPDGRRFSQSIFHRDYAIVTQSKLFRQLSQKTQTFAMGKTEPTRTPLTHAIEASQIGSQLAGYFSRKLSDANLIQNKDSSFSDDFRFLTMSACLARHFGQPPFGTYATNQLKSYATEIKSEFNNDKQTAHILMSPVLYEDIDLSAPLVAATFKSTRLDDISYAEDRALISQLLESLNLKAHRHPATFIVEAAHEMASLAADFENYLRYFSNESPKTTLEKLSIGDLIALDENYNPTGPLHQALLNHLRIDGEERFQIAVATIVRSLFFYTCSHLDKFFQQQSLININDVPMAMTEYSDKNSFDGPCALYFNNSQSEDRGALIAKLKGDLHIPVLETSQIGQQDILSKKIADELWPSLKTLTDPDFTSSKMFKHLPASEKGLFVLASQNEQGYTLQRALLDFVSGMTELNASDLLKKLTNSATSAA